jgi:hypothetical protein
VFDRRIELAEEADLALVAEAHDVALRKPLRRTHEGAPARAIEPLRQGRLDPGLGGVAQPPADEPRRDHLGVVDHQRVAGRQQLGEIAHGAVIELRRAARPHHEEPCGIARNRRPQRDAVGGQVEIEQVGSHDLGMLSWPVWCRP